MTERGTDLPFLDHLIISPDIGLRRWVRLVVKLVSGVGFSTVVESSFIPRVERIRLHYAKIGFHAVPEVHAKVFALQFTQRVSMCLNVFTWIPFGGWRNRRSDGVEIVGTRINGVLRPRWVFMFANEVLVSSQEDE